jgi:PhnB protein
MNSYQLSPYLNFNGNCEEAMTFYQSVFGGDLEIRRFSELANPDMPVSDTQKDKVMHATLMSEHVSFMASDGQEGRSVNFGDSISMSLVGKDEIRLTDYFYHLSEGGMITLPLSVQPWNATFGMLTDKFGIHWMVNIG